MVIEKLVAVLPSRLRGALPDRLRYPVIQCWAVTDSAGLFHPMLGERAESLVFGSRLTATGQGATASSLVIGNLDYTALGTLETRNGRVVVTPHIQVFESVAIAMLMSVPSREIRDASPSLSLSGWAPEVLWRCNGPLIARDGLVAAVTDLTPVSRVPLKPIFTFARVAFAVRTALAVGGDRDLTQWAEGWLDGLDRSVESARKLSDALSEPSWERAIYAASLRDDKSEVLHYTYYELMEWAYRTWAAALYSAIWMSEAESNAGERAVEGILAAGQWSTSSGKQIDFETLANEELARDMDGLGDEREASQ